MTFYPHLETILTELKSQLSLEYNVEVYADMSDISIQKAPYICLVAEPSEVKDLITDGKTIKSIRTEQFWTILVVVRNASDQLVTKPLLLELGLLMGKVINVLCKRIITSGGPLRIVDFPQPIPIQGGGVAGKIRIGIQFLFNSE